jgi:hypothetical protein
MPDPQPGPEPVKPRGPRTRAEREFWGRVGALESWSRTIDPAARTAAGREASVKRFERQVDPDGVLDPAERARRAQQAMRAYMMRLAAKSAAARRAKSTKRVPGS